MREVDDLITLLLFLDENKLLSALPKYVSSSPDSMPSARLLEGDLNVFLVMLEKMGNNFEEYRSALAAIVNDVGELRSKVAATDQFPVLQARLAHLYRCLRGYNRDSRSLRRSYGPITIVILIRARFERDSSMIQHPTRSYVLSSNN